jgi:PAS domain S-box-containing protein
MKTWLICGLAFWSLGIGPHAQAHDRPPSSNVLILFSYHDQLPWQTRVLGTVREKLASESGAPQVFTERLDANRFPGAADQAAIGSFILGKYAKVKLSLVIAESDAASAFLLAHPDAFPGAQRTFVNTSLPVAPEQGFAVIRGSRIDPTLALIAKVFPSTRHVILVSSHGAGDTIMGRWNAAFQHLYTMELWKDVTFAELDARVRTLAADTVLLFDVFSIDSDSRTAPSGQVFRRVAAEASVPAFVMYDTLLDTGAVGGYVLSGEEVGQVIVDLVLGRPVAHDSQQLYRYVFDADALSRWNVGQDRLPDGSELTTKPGFLLSRSLVVELVAGVAGAVMLALVVWILWLLREIRRRQRAEQLAQRLKATLDEAQWGLAMSDKTVTAMEYVNLAMARLHGYSLPELTARSFATLIAPDSPFQLKEILQRATDGGSCTVDTLQLRRDGTKFPAIVTITKVLLPENAGPRYVANVIDISEREKAELEQARLEGQLLQAQKMESLGRMAGGIAHDMNNVLAAILATSTTKLLTLPEDDPVRQAFVRISAAAERGGKMVQRLLSFSRVTPADDARLDLNSIVEETVALIEPITPSGIRVELDLDPDLGRIQGDRNAMSSALMNICVNALDAMAGRGTLSLRTHGSEGFAHLEVEDSGVGMPPDVLARATEPFFTTKPTGKGTGLGLALVYSTVAAHQGTIDLSSEPGRGTIVRLRLPIAEPVRTPSGETPSDAVSAPEAGFLVLLVDDDVMVLEPVEEGLKAQGYRVTSAASGEEALDLINGGLRPRVIILDMDMPGLGGKETLEILRNTGYQFSVLLATGRPDHSVLELLVQFSGVGLIAKPFTLEELHMELEAIASRG